MPKVTIGLPTFNRAKFLGQTIKLILEQTFQDFELIVSDDASADGTARAVSQFTDSRILYHRNQFNLGIPGNLNKILELSSGEYIVILHDHDIFHKELIERMVNVMEEHQSVGLVHPGIAWVDDNGSNYSDMIKSFEGVIRGKSIVESILFGKDFSSPISACGLVRRNCYEEQGFRFDPRFGFVSDVDMWLRIALHHDVGFIPESLITCRRRDNDHQYATVNWTYVNWVVDIHRVNIERIYSKNQKRFYSALKCWKRKARRHFIRNLFASAARGDLATFQDGFRYIGTQNVGSMTLIARVVTKSPITQKLLMQLIKGVAKLKKLLT